ncbi:HIRAN domain-containing protein [Ostreibacterium oceani]|uniref:Restriction endonuclease n=1 Tax=Ostreibacterium oceani TaxID=2654998 RepID=A0A6N7ESB5_9GAMM|nr:HIRAN domain-containing protein [Ostreibacterium oceani]MPV85392.1 restriction endonuclease [Ostreibacterium oceani]
MMHWLRQWFKKNDKDSNWIADVSIAGLQHYRGNDLAELIKIGDELQLAQQPDNQHDAHAIVVLWHNNKIGYIPRALAKEINQQIESGVPIAAKIIDLNSVRFGRKWIKIRLSARA